MATKTAQKNTTKKVEALTAPVYSIDGKKKGEVTLNADVFGVRWNGDLVHDVVSALMANSRAPLAHTKMRGEVSGTGKKPWRQKGTGRARHGSRRSPIWRTGGVAHGPRNDRDYSRKVNKKAARKALSVTLSRKLKDGEIIFVEDITFDKPKTVEAKAILTNLSKVEGYKDILKSRGNAAMIALGPTSEESSEAVKRSFNNIGTVDVEEVRNLNSLDVLSHKFLIITRPDDSVAFFNHKFEK